MARAEKMGRPLGRLVVSSWVLNISMAACGGGLSSDERWELDADPPLDSAEAEPIGPALNMTSECAVVAEQQLAAAGYRYATPPGFWQGSQETKTLAVDGAGYFVWSEPNGEPPGYRYSRDVSFFVAPDGSLQDTSGRRLLGYAPAGARCLAPLRAPWLAPPVATALVVIHVNLDPRDLVVEFVVEEPEGSSNLSTTVSVTDSEGGPHLIDIYFNHLREPDRAYDVHVLTDGSELVGQVPGARVLLGSGRIAFASDGNLFSDVMPTICASFSGGALEQCFSIDFGHSMADGNPIGLGGSTGFASGSAVYAQSADGLVVGLGADVQVDGWGRVSAGFDNGAGLALGTLALARFPREPSLVTQPDGVLRASDESGQPQLGIPLSLGRGSVRFDESQTPSPSPGMIGSE